MCLLCTYYIWSIRIRGFSSLFSISCFDQRFRSKNIRPPDVTDPNWVSVLELRLFVTLLLIRTLYTPAVDRWIWIPGSHFQNQGSIIYTPVRFFLVSISYIKIISKKFTFPSFSEVWNKLKLKPSQIGSSWVAAR